MNTTWSHQINSSEKIDNFPILKEDEIKSDLKTILDTKMTRDRNLTWVNENLPTLNDFIKHCIQNWSKKMMDLCSGKWILADDIQNKYNQDKKREEYIKIWRADILWAQERQSDQKAIGWRINLKIDIRDLPDWLTDIYSLFWLQYFHDSPEILENIRKKLEVWSRAYIQFPEGIRSNQALDEFTKANKWKNIVVYIDDTNKNFYSIIFEFWKESEDDQSLVIPKFIVKKWFPLQWNKTWEKVINSDLFYRIWSENNDPERKNAENIHNNRTNIVK